MDNWIGDGYVRITTAQVQLDKQALMSFPAPILFDFDFVASIIHFIWLFKLSHILSLIFKTFWHPSHVLSSKVS